MKKYQNIIEAIQDNLVSEDPNARRIIVQLRPARKRGYLTKKEFLDICNWKSPRPRRHFEKNSEEAIRNITQKAFSTGHEKTKIIRLTKLKGVRIPTASAILALTYPHRYGVIDIRVWQCLYKYGAVKDNPAGTNFSPEQWYRYLVKLRFYAKKLKESPRIVELTMFFHHKKMIQQGNLYKS